MEFRGKCHVLDKIVVSDPSYGEDVWCRYERNDINGREWKVHGFINEETAALDGVSFSGKSIVLAMASPDEYFILHEDGSFSHSARNEVNDFTIGMDTACVGFGVNAHADDIKNSRDAWQPSHCLRTLTDGEFGSVYECSSNGEVRLLVLTGWLDDDTGYSVQDILDYLVASLDIELERTRCLEEVLADADARQTSHTPTQTLEDKDDIGLS